MRKILIFIILILIIIVLSFKEKNSFYVIESELPSIKYKVYLPNISQSGDQRFGIALADWNNPKDINTLGVSWIYDWHSSPANTYSVQYIPMLWSGNISSSISSSYSGYILFLNEPNLSNQSNLSPEISATKYKNAKQYYKNATILCCGVSIFAYSWMENFVKIINPDGIHLHIYLEEWVDLNYVKDNLTKFYSLSNGEFWISEYNSLNSTKEFEDLTKYLISEEKITRIAPYSNRQIEGQSTNLPEELNLINPDGNLSDKGLFYKTMIKEGKK